MGKSKLVKNNFSLGYSTGDFVLHSNVNDGAIFGASMYQKVKPNIETGVNLGWTASSNTTSQIGLGYQQKLRDGVTVTLSTLIDGKNFNQGGHKIGMALELET